MNGPLDSCKNLPQRSYPPSETDSSRPLAAAALVIPDRAALIFSAYCNGIRVDFHPPACVIAAKSMSSAARALAAPIRVECPPTSATVDISHCWPNLRFQDKSYNFLDCA